MQEPSPMEGKENAAQGELSWLWGYGAGSALTKAPAEPV